MTHTQPTLTDRFAGCLLGLAIGDAVGAQYEGQSADFISRRFGSVKKLLENIPPNGLYYTDDTQMAEQVMRALLDEREDLDRCMTGMAKRFVEWSRHPQGGHRAPGNACMTGCRALESGAHWSQAGGQRAGGCGSVMRAYPFGIIFMNDLATCERFAVAHSKLTHRDPIALAASAAMAIGIALALRGRSVRRITSEMVAAACRYSPRTAEMMCLALDDARRGIGPEETLDRLRAWAAHEAIAAAVYVFARHGNDARSAILEGANTPGDSDSIATLAGALVGARVGVEGLPAEWVREVERTEELTELADRAAEKIVPRTKSAM